MPAFLAISINSFIAAPYGAGISNRLPEAHLKKIFAIISLVLSIKMLGGCPRIGIVARESHFESDFLFI